MGSWLLLVGWYFCALRPAPLALSQGSWHEQLEGCCCWALPLQ